MHNLFSISVLVLAQLFAILPIYGIKGESSKELKFAWINYRMLHTTIILCGVMSMVIISIVWGASTTISFKQIGN